MPVRVRVRVRARARVWARVWARVRVDARIEESELYRVRARAMMRVTAIMHGTNQCHCYYSRNAAGREGHMVNLGFGLGSGFVDVGLGRGATPNLTNPNPN